MTADADNVLAQINLRDHRLSELESIAMAKILTKREQYIRQGRAGEAHGAGTAVWILWLELTQGRQHITGWSEL